MQKTKVKKKQKELPMDVKTIEQAIRIVKEKGLTKIAHRPNGKLTWIHMTDLPTETRDAVRDYLTQYPDMSIHYLSQLALEVYLKVPLDVRIPYVVDEIADRKRSKVNRNGGDKGRGTK